MRSIQLQQEENDIAIRKLNDTLDHIQNVKEELKEEATEIEHVEKENFRVKANIATISESKLKYSNLSGASLSFSSICRNR
jgi:S-adenosylmethionine synthetase